MSKKTKDNLKFNRLNVREKEWLKLWSELGETLETALRNVLNRVHESKPKVVFLTQTSSIPYGFALKEAYKHAYPDEPQPKFLTIDVKPARRLRSDFDGINRLYAKHVPEGFIYDLPFHELRRINEDRLPRNWDGTKIYHKEQEEVERKVEDDIQKRIDEASSVVIEKTKEKLRKYGVKDEDSILLMDEHIGDNEESSRSEVIKKIKTGEAYKRTAGIAYKVIEGASSSISPRIKVDFDFIFNNRLQNQEDGSLGPWVGSKVSHYGKEERIHPTRRYQGKEERDISRENMNYFKDIGRKAGEEIAQERKKKKDLEQHLSAIIGIGGLIASLFFLSPKITGNIIGNVGNQDSNIIGAILFIIGLIGGFFWIRSSKRN